MHHISITVGFLFIASRFLINRMWSKSSTSLCIIMKLGTLYRQTLALTSPTSGGLSVGIVRSRTQATECSVSVCYVCQHSGILHKSFLSVRGYVCVRKRIPLSVIRYRGNEYARDNGTIVGHTCFLCCLVLWKENRLVNSRTFSYKIIFRTLKVLIFTRDSDGTYYSVRAQCSMVVVDTSALEVSQSVNQSVVEFKNA
jgi:hypothetical protein